MLANESKTPTLDAAQNNYHILCLTTGNMRYIRRKTITELDTYTWKTQTHKITANKSPPRQYHHRTLQLHGTVRFVPPMCHWTDRGEAKAPISPTSHTVGLTRNNQLLLIVIPLNCDRFAVRVTTILCRWHSPCADVSNRWRQMCVWRHVYTIALLIWRCCCHCCYYCCCCCFRITAKP